VYGGHRAAQRGGKRRDRGHLSLTDWRSRRHAACHTQTEETTEDTVAAQDMADAQAAARRPAEKPIPFRADYAPQGRSRGDHAQAVSHGAAVLATAGLPKTRLDHLLHACATQPDPNAQAYWTDHAGPDANQPLARLEPA